MNAYGTPQWSNTVGFMNPQAPQQQPQVGGLGAAMSPPAQYGMGGGGQQDMMMKMLAQKLMANKAAAQTQAQAPGQNLAAGVAPL